ncbi:MAG: zinc ribbon domain-containing protein [Chloroflexi bacterium]|nr:zinc ribbon domain-containing protein [Chloroflexota bacterium]
METDVDSEQIMCVSCGTACPVEWRHCPACGSPIGQICPACGEINPLTARDCSACGQILDVTEALLDRVVTERTAWLRHVREEAPSHKIQEQNASKARLDAMWELEAQRQTELKLSLAERERQQRIIVSITVGVVAVVVIALLILLALNAGQTMP